MDARRLLSMKRDQERPELRKAPMSFPLRLSPTMRSQIDVFASSEGISVNQFISLAIAEKLARMEQTAEKESATLRKSRP